MLIGPALKQRPSQLLLTALLSLVLAKGAAAQDPGYERSYVIRADAAWISPTERMSPVFVGVAKGKIEWVGKTNRTEGQRGGLIPTAPPRVIEVQGTLAAGIVDAWCTLGSADLLGEGREAPTRRVLDSLPLQRGNEDPLLAAQILAARDSGIAALYLSSGWGRLRSGVGTAAALSGFDLPVPRGLQALDCAVGGNVGASATYAAQDLRDAFDEAQDWRDSQDEYQEKLTQYAKDLEEYQKKLDEFVKKSAEKKEGEKKEDPPKRPERPKEPRPNTARDLLLQAMDGEIGLRVAADDPQDILQLIALREKHGLDLTILGGWWADLVAAELAAADVPVILAALPDHHARRFPDRSLVARWRVLQAAGVRVALASGGGEAEQALLLARAGELVAAGENPEKVWAALTEVPADLLGLGGEYGGIGEGRSASLILFQGTSPFDASASLKAHKPR